MKEIYEAKQRYVDNLMAKNAQVKTLTDEQHDALSSIARLRHEFHTSTEDYWSGESNNPTHLQEIEQILDESDLPALYIDWDLIDLPISGLDWDYVLTEDEKEKWEKKAEEEMVELKKRGEKSLFPLTGFDLWRDEHYDEFFEYMESINKKIENYLEAIDKKHGTNYAPTGCARIR